MVHLDVHKDRQIAEGLARFVALGPCTWRRHKALLSMLCLNQDAGHYMTRHVYSHMRCKCSSAAGVQSPQTSNILYRCACDSKVDTLAIQQGDVMSLQTTDDTCRSPAIVQQWNGMSCLKRGFQTQEAFTNGTCPTTMHCGDLEHAKE